MEPEEEVANRMQAVGLEGGVVMLVWHNRFNRKSFFEEERRGPRPGPGQAGKRRRTAEADPKKKPPEKKQGAREKGNTGARKRGRERPARRGSR